MAKAYQDSGFAYQGTGEFAYQNTSGTPPPPVSGNLSLWAVGPKGIKTRTFLTFVSKVEPDTED